MSTSLDTSTTVTLDRLLTRLEHTLLSSAADARLRRSKYERARIVQNVEHAQTLLLTLDKQCAGIRVQTQKQQAQNELARRRDIIKRLNARLQELGDIQAESSDEDDEDAKQLGDTGVDTEHEAREPANGFGPARQGLNTGHDIGESQPLFKETQAQSTLRARHPGAQEQPAASTSAREQLFAGRKQQPDLETSEALMSHHRLEQEALSNGLLGLARSLKESSLNFASALESEKDIMKRAEGGLDKSAQSMEAAEQKMGLLRRMSEGQGWWGRIKLYGLVGGLWLVMFLFVFVGPKLRF